MRVEFKNVVNAYQCLTNIKIPHEVKSTQYFQLSGYKKTRQHVFLKLSESQDSEYFIMERNLLVTTKLDLSREFILMQNSPLFDN